MTTNINQATIDAAIAAAAELNEAIIASQLKTGSKSVTLAGAVYQIADAFRAAPDQAAAYMPPSATARTADSSRSLFLRILRWLARQAHADQISAGTLSKIASVCEHALKNGVPVNKLQKYVGENGGFAAVYDASVAARKGRGPATNSHQVPAELKDASDVVILDQKGNMFRLEVPASDIKKLVRRYGVQRPASNDNYQSSNDNRPPVDRGPTRAATAETNGEGRIRQTASPLQHMGGKSKVAKKLRNLRPHDAGVHTYIDPFGGGASFPLALNRLQNGSITNFLIRDAFPPLINFWQRLQREPEELAKKVMNLVDLGNNSQETYEKSVDAIIEWLETDANGVEAAAGYYIHSHVCHPAALFKLKKNSFASSKSEWLGRIQNRLPQLQEWSSIIQKWDFRLQDYRSTLKEAIDAGDETFLFVDPPYEQTTGQSSPEDVYGCSFTAEDQDHVAAVVRRAAGSGVKCMVTTNFSPENYRRYEGFKRIIRSQPYGSKNKSGKSKNGVELVVLTYDIPKISEKVANLDWKI